MKRQMRTVLGSMLTAVVVIGLFGAAADAQTLMDQRLFLVSTDIVTGSGTVRLDGMGGFEAVVSDENFELNPYDFSRNPAGFGDDRDSWSIDLRYTHNELVERDERTSGQDVKSNDGTLLVAYHAPGNVGVGGRIDYAEVGSGESFTQRNDYKLAGLELLISKYLTPKLSVGVNVSQLTEEESAFSRDIYKISHDNVVSRGGLGVTYAPVAGVIVGGRAELVSTQLDGTSRGPFHTDLFDWSRPGGFVSLQGFVNRGRFEAGVDYSRQELEGEETVVISWSERFQFNPIADTFHLETDTFTEDRTDETINARGRFFIIPGRLTAGAALRSRSQNADVLVNPNVVGSQLSQSLETTLDVFVAGVSWTGLRDRLLLAGEVKRAETKVTGNIDDHPLTTSRKETALRVGGEYLLGESLVGRAGLGRARESLEFAEATDLEGDFNSTYVALGLGIVPSGAIWQLDIAYETSLSSDLDTDRSRFSAYIKYLF